MLYFSLIAPAEATVTVPYASYVMYSCSWQINGDEDNETNNYTDTNNIAVVANNRHAYVILNEKSCNTSTFS